MKFLWVVSWVLFAATCVAVSDAARDANSSHPTIRQIKIAKANVEVTGAYLGRVEIWLEPTGTGVGEVLVGQAKRVTAAGPHERWIFPIASLPGYPHPIMAVDAFAKGYDHKGKQVGRKGLGFSGVTEFNAALYGRAVQ